MRCVWKCGCMQIRILCRRNRVLLYVWTLVGWVVTLMGAKADPNENKSKMRVFLGEVAYLCVCVCVHVQFSMLRRWAPTFWSSEKEALFTRKFQRKYQPITVRVKTLVCKKPVWYVKLAAIAAHTRMLLQRGQRFKVLRWTFEAELTNTAGNMYIAFRVIYLHLLIHSKLFLEGGACFAVPNTNHSPLYSIQFCAGHFWNTI